MKKYIRSGFAGLAFGLSLFAAVAFNIAPAFAAASSVNDQVPGPVPSTSNNGAQSEVLTQSLGISGGTLYWNCWRGNGLPTAGVPVLTGCSGPSFVPTNLSGAYTRWLDLSGARLDTGVVSTATSSPTAPAFAVERTAGASYALVGQATSASGITTKAMWETDVASTYASGTAIPVVVNANYTGSGTVTAASTTLTVNAYTEVGGVETAISGITAAQQFTGTAANYTFNIPSTAGLVPGQHITIEVVMLVTTSANAATGQINSVGLTD